MTTRSGVALDAAVRVERPGGFVLDMAIAADPGEIVAVLGPSGAGKSTLLGALAGLDRLDAGHVRVGDRTVSSRERHVPPAHRGVALLGQDSLLFPHLTARENVAFPMRAAGVPRAIARDRADDWLDRLGLAGLGPRRPDELSGGQQQRAALARALAAEPHVVLLDEPLTGLDVETASEIREVLRRQVRAAEVTTVLVTHSAVDAAALADRIFVVEAGIVTQRGPVAEVLRSPRTRFAAAVAGVNRVEGAVRAGQWADAAGAGIRIPAPGTADGRAHAVFAPRAMRSARTPGGPAAAGDVVAWTARVRRIEPVPFGARVHTTSPDTAVEVTADALADGSWEVGCEVWLSVDLAAVRVVPAGAAPGSLSP
ncbi:ABC transporter ATP-binding protein [Microbacterium sp. SSW1-59]|uniref:ABC transporter ATP-binding protein n=1 Tax=Microbacterium xanthum TaxID=3079794 RepID=UPI002AD511B1|nr:ABC transporter ATP-binding protein [Microbacterium sp. SSW1-59]MDZ8200050.1 ABC transporter ATP-binding protein [Microbacterium sp. SSW1-59]